MIDRVRKGELVHRHSRLFANCLVAQRQENDCVIATVATIANLPYESVAELSPRRPGKEGLFPHEVRSLLQYATHTAWSMHGTVPFCRRLRALCDSSEPLVLFIRQPGNALIQRLTRKTQHCIVVCDGEVFDPEYADVIHADDYERIRWTPTIKLSPVDARTLRQVQADNCAQYRDVRLWSEFTGLSETYDSNPFQQSRRPHG